MAASPSSTRTRSRLSFDGIPVYRRGSPTGAVPELGGPACRIEVDLGLGMGRAAYLASDLSTDYVRINAEYTT